MNSSTLVTLGLLTVVFLGIGIYERKPLHTRQLALIVALSALAGLSRVPFGGLPSVQPTTFIILYTGYVFGPFTGCVVGSTAAWISNFFMIQGQGPWTIWQMFAWGLVGLSAGSFRFIAVSRARFFLLMLGILWGFLFGWIMNFWVWLTFSYPLSFKTWLSVNVASFWFDVTHSVNNVIFILVFGQPLLKILIRFKQKASGVHTETPSTE